MTKIHNFFNFNGYFLFMPVARENSTLGLNNLTFEFSLFPLFQPDVSFLVCSVYV